MNVFENVHVLFQKFKLRHMRELVMAVNGMFGSVSQGESDFPGFWFLLAWIYQDNVQLI